MLNLATVIANHRWASKQSLRELGKEIGIDHASLMRIEQGYSTDTLNTAKIVRWLFSENGEAARRAPTHQKRMKATK